MDEITPQESAVNNVAVEDNSVTPSASEETTTSTPQESTADTGQSDSTPTEEPKQEQSSDVERQQVRPAQRRIQGLVEENKSLKEQLGRFDSTPFTPPPQQKLSDYFAGQDSVLPEDLDKAAEQMTAQAANGLVDIKVQALEQKLVQQQAVSNLEKDSALLPKEYPELDEKSDKYNPRLEETIAETWKKLAVHENPYNNQIKVIDPKVSLAEIAKGLVDLTRSAAEQGKASAHIGLANLADNAAMTPGTDTAPEKKFEDLSVDEMEASLRAKGYQV